MTRCESRRKRQLIHRIRCPDSETRAVRKKQGGWARWRTRPEDVRLAEEYGKRVSKGGPEAVRKASRKVLNQLGRALHVHNYLKLDKGQLSELILDELFLSGLQEKGKNYSKTAQRIEKGIPDNLFTKSNLVRRIVELEDRVSEVHADLTAPDAVKSLQSLIKSNNGAFKSEKQAKFLYNQLNCSFYRGKASEAWGKKYVTHKYADRNATPIQIMVFMEQFGRTDPSKVRYYGYLYVIDGAGVVAAAKADVEHYSSRKGTTFGIVGPKGPPIFVRNRSLPTLYDQVLEQQRQNQRAAKNAPLIEKIENIRGYQRNHFLQDLVFQLSNGHDLSPKQQIALNKYLPVEMDTTEWSRAYDVAIRMIAEKFVGPVNDVLRKRTVDRNFEAFLLQFIDSFKDFKRKPQVHLDMGRGSGFGTLLHALDWKCPSGRNWDYTLLYYLNKAAKKGAKAPKKAIDHVRDALALSVWLERLPKQKVVKLLSEML